MPVKNRMRGLEWGRLYREYGKNAYDPAAVSADVRRLSADYFVKKRSGIFEYVLGGLKDSKLLEVRIFDEPAKRSAYARQTAEAKENGVSNCPLCAAGHEANKSKIWDIKEMDADHVSAWSKGDATDVGNCQMLCRTHNHAKGNK